MAEAYPSDSSKPLSVPKDAMIIRLDTSDLPTHSSEFDWDMLLTRTGLATLECLVTSPRAVIPYKRIAQSMRLAMPGLVHVRRELVKPAQQEDETFLISPANTLHLRFTDATSTQEGYDYGALYAVYQCAREFRVALEETRIDLLPSA